MGQQAAPEADHADFDPAGHAQDSQGQLNMLHDDIDDD